MSFDHQRDGILTYVALFGGAAALASVAVVTFVAIERRKHAGQADAQLPGPLPRPRSGHADTPNINQRIRESLRNAFNGKVRDELVAAIDDGEALRANIFQSPHYGPFRIWRDKTRDFVEAVFGAHERQRFEQDYDPPPQSYGDSLTHRLRRLADLRDRPETWELQVREDGLSQAAAERRARDEGEQIVEAYHDGPSRSDPQKRLLPVKRLLSEATEEGRSIIGTSDQDVIARWTHDTGALIEAAFSSLEATQFRGGEGYEYPPDSGSQNERLNDYLDARLRRLSELVPRVESLTIDPDFDPDEWRAPLATRAEDDPIRRGWLLLYRIALLSEQEARVEVMTWLAEVGTDGDPLPGAGKNHLEAVVKQRLGQLEDHDS